MNSSYMRTKEEYLELVKQARADNGTELKLPVVRLHQREKLDMFTAPLRQDICQLLFQRLPRDYNNQDGIQRAYKATKIADIKEAAKNDPLYTAPGSIVVSVRTKDRPWVRLSLDTNDRTGVLIVDLKEVQKKLSELDPDDQGALDEESFKIGYMIDAHHRTEGHYLAGKLDLEMGSTIYMNLPKKEMARVFSLVNDKQDKPSPTHTLAMRQMAGMLEKEEKLAVEIGQAINQDENSILYRRVKTVDGRLPKDHPKTYVNLKTLADLLQRFVIREIPGSETSTKQALIEHYFRAWETTFPKQWQDDTKHVLVKAMGFTIMCRLFPKLFEITSVKHHSQAPTQSQFEGVMKIMRTLKIETDHESNGKDDGKSVPLSWRSEVFGSLSSGKGINFLVNQIQKQLTDRRMELIGRRSRRA
jgi:DGQHR domain-containing protein